VPRRAGPEVDGVLDTRLGMMGLDRSVPSDSFCVPLLDYRPYRFALIDLTGSLQGLFRASSREMRLNNQFSMVPSIILKKFLWGLVGSQKGILDSLRMHFLNIV